MSVAMRNDVHVSAEADFGLGYLQLFSAALRGERPLVPERHPFFSRDHHQLQVFDEDWCALLRAHFDRHAPGPVEAASLGHPEVHRLLDAVFRSGVADAVYARFGTHFWPINFSLQRLVPPGVGPTPPNSPKWHCDWGPAHHLRLIVYLDPPEAHDSGTWILDRATTDALKRVGYIFCPLTDRTTDLAPWLERLGLEGAPRLLRLGLGEGLLFEPAQIAHRSQLPTFGQRTALHLALIPAPRPWHEFVRDQFSVVRSSGFPRIDLAPA